MKLPRFTIRELLIAILLLSAGRGFWTWGSYVDRTYGSELPSYHFLATALYFVGPACVGAGVLTPFHMQRLGAAVGLALGYCAVRHGLFLAMP